MAGFFTSLLLSGLLAQAPGGFTFEGREASARTEQPDGFFIQGPLPFTDLAESGLGSASLDVEDRVSLPGATYGDRARLDATFRLGVVEYRVELTQAGFPPPQVRGQAASGPLPRPPPHAIQGGVWLDVPLYGDSGLGWAAMTRTHAAAAVWGVGSVWRNGQLLTDTAFIHASALAAGTFADDDTHRLLRQARYEDTELVVVAWNLPTQLEPRGFVQFVFEDVGITVDDTAVRSVAVVEATGNPPQDWRALTPVPPTAILGLPPTASAAPAEAGVGGSGTTDLATAPGGTPETTPGTAAEQVGVPGGGRDIVTNEQGAIVTVGGATTGTGPTGVGAGAVTTPLLGAEEPVPPADLGVVGGPVTATTPSPAEGSGAFPGTGQPSVAGVAGGALLTPPGSTIGPAQPGSVVPGLAATPDVTSGTFPVTGAPNPPVNISGVLPGTPAPGSQAAAEGSVTPGAAPPGSASGVGPASRPFALPPTVSGTGTFTVQTVSPPDFDAFLGTAQVSPGIIATAPPLNSDTATPPSALLGSPAPLNAGQAPPLLGTPAPLNSAPATSLPAAPAPANVSPGASTSTVAPAAPAAPAVSPGGTGVPPSI